MDRRATPPKPVTSSTWGSLPPCKQALSLRSRRDHSRNVRMRHIFFFFAAEPREWRLRAAKTKDFLACLFCFPISDNIMMPQTTFSFKCCLMHVNPRAYVCIITEIPWRTSRGLNQENKVYKLKGLFRQLRRLYSCRMITFKEYLLYKVSLFYLHMYFFLSFFF